MSRWSLRTLDKLMTSLAVRKGFSVRGRSGFVMAANGVHIIIHT